MLTHLQINLYNNYTVFLSVMARTIVPLPAIAAVNACHLNKVPKKKVRSLEQIEGARNNGIIPFKSDPISTTLTTVLAFS